jgi:predicted nucleic acid-binding protein
VPAGVLGEAWRGGPQPQLSRLLKGCLVEPLTATQARAVGVLAARSGLTDTVDLAVAEGALRRNDAVVTSNRTHIQQAAVGVGRQLAIHDV